jgi:hypothetical protein
MAYNETPTERLIMSENIKTMDEIKNMTEEEVAAENTRLGKLLVKRYAIQMAVVVGVTVAVNLIARKIENSTPSQNEDI